MNLKRLYLIPMVLLLTINSTFAQTNDALIASLSSVINHVSGTQTLTNAQLVNQQSIINENATSFGNDTAVIDLAFNIVSTYDANFGALFTNGTTTSGGISPRTSSGFDLERLMMTIMQNIHDHSYTEANLLAYPNLFNDVKFETSSYFPGPATPPSNSNVNYTVRINADHIKNTGAPANYETEDARRPTGCYLAPGSVATVTVPTSLVGIGASVLVGAHTWDNAVKPNIRRMDRVTKEYEINSSTVTIANPLGGGIYINVPFQTSAGIVNVTIQNAIRSPYFANTVANQTSASDWENEERLHQAPWADFETEKVMHQVPTSWIYNLSDPSSVMDDWDASMDAVSELLGRPLSRSKTVAYQQVDLQFRGSAFFPGYPQANITYDPNRDYGGNHNHFLNKGPRDRSHSLALDTFYHELGHAERIFKFSGEIESIVNFLYVAVYNKKFGVELQEAFVESSTTNVEHTLDEAAISWMITENFRLGNQMSLTTGQFRQEFSYQPRGYAKYVEIVDLFGWEALEDFYTTLNEDYDAGNYESANINVNRVPTDPRTLRMSVAAGFDLRPLLHFWGKIPDNASGLAASIEASGVKQSADIYDRLQYYKTIVPVTNESFRNFGLNDFSLENITGASTTNDGNVSQSYTNSFFRKFWSTYDQEEGQAAINQIDTIIDLYFPDGRPEDESTPIPPTTSTFTPDPNKTYYIDVPVHNLRLAATGTSENPYTTAINTTGEDVEWQFVQHSSGSWHIQLASGGTKPRLRSDNSSKADMQETTSSGGWTYYDITDRNSDGTYFLTLPVGPTNFKRLQIDNLGGVNMVPTTFTGDWVSFKITEVSTTNIVHIANRNAAGFAIDGNNNGINNQNIYLWSEDTTNVNQQWIEIDRGDGYYTYQKQDTNFCIDGGGANAENGQNVYLWECSDNNLNQHWRKVATAGGTYRLENRNASAFSLDGGGPNAENRQNVYLWSSNNNNQNQQWFITPVGASAKSIAGLTITDEFVIYPNPVKSTATIKDAQGATVRVYDMNGKIILEQIISETIETLSMDNLSVGVYYAEILTGTKRQIIKLVRN